MDKKEAVHVLKANYPCGRAMLGEAVDVAIKELEKPTYATIRNASTDDLLREIHRRVRGAVSADV